MNRTPNYPARWVVVIVVFATLFWGCDSQQLVEPTGTVVFDRTSSWPLERAGPDEFGVVCYWQRSSRSQSLQCVKVTP